MQITHEGDPFPLLPLPSLPATTVCQNLQRGEKQKHELGVIKQE